MQLIVTASLRDEIEPHIRATIPDIELICVDQDGTPDGDLAGAEALLRWWLPRPALTRIINAAPRLRWIHTPSAGVDTVLSPEMIERNITLTNSAGAHAIPIAEFVLMFMLNRVKRARELFELTPQNAWERGDNMELNELYGKTLLIIGLGHIGQEVAIRAASFGMRVFGSRRRPQPITGVEQVVGEGEWRTLLPEADYIVIAAPLTDSTRGMIDAEAFAQMKPGAYLINIARGQIIDTEALLAALHDGKLGGAGLDALPEEPLPEEHPLWRAPNVWITPHISWSSPRMKERSFALFVENLRRFCNDEPLLNVVDVATGY
jgi:phosphoglycerate dehydrogenase-like enzyme